MNRNIFERTLVEGFRTGKVETLAVTSQCRRFFVGTNEGALILYETNTRRSTAESMLIFLYFIQLL